MTFAIEGWSEARTCQEKQNVTLLIFKIYFIKLAQKTETQGAGATREGASNINSLSPAQVICLPRWGKKEERRVIADLQVCFFWTLLSGAPGGHLVLTIKSEMVMVVRR